MSQFNASTPLLNKPSALSPAEAPAAFPSFAQSDSFRALPHDEDASLLAALARQADIVVSQKKVKKERPSAKAGLSAEAKQRMELANAVSRETPSGVQALLDDGCDPNFLVVRGGVLVSPLSLACKNSWFEGVSLLIERGAQESLARAQHAEESGASKEELAKIAQEQTEQWTRIHDCQIFEALMGSESDEAQLKNIAQSIAGDPRKALFLLKNQQERLPSAKNWASVEKVAWGHLQWQAMIARPLSPAAVMLKLLWERFPEMLTKDNDERWAAVIRGNRAELLSFLAKSGAPGPQDWMVSAVPSDFDVINGYAPEPLVMRQKDSSGREIMIHVVGGAQKVDVLTLAVLAGAADCVAALGRCEPLLRRAQQDPDAARWMASGDMSPKKLPALREAQKSGLDLTRFVNGKGETPLHGLCRRYKVSKTAFFEMARICPEWMSKKGDGGKTPVELLTQKYGSGDHRGIEKAVAEIEALWMRKDMREVKAEIREEVKAAKKAAPKKRQKSVEDAPVAAVALAPAPPKRTSRRL